ncbi:HlyD family type I secretion periplasmic adaptor subunit [Sphingomonas sp. M1-B02]|uniref:HlyD family type I secretion periplasmic adaptor subunit n=1 Tax=Sphingomonas sp. M1-B02 TaxID=3114300 RepID=UPI00223EF4A7|nr:HlyD family type I secretion periplasmic adaptor subunit [Sphingomonas sp. S6-11]UZK65041.1 HlyD family type I secretion periplasmic adaptor subunit [Sphingomonas sp. S6-11]
MNMQNKQDMQVPTESPTRGEPRLLQPNRMSNFLLYGTLGFFALMLLWAIFTKIDRTVHASGRVVPTAQLQRVSNLEGGVVAEILVRAGQMVKAGDPLIRLDRTAAESDYSSSQSSIASLTAKIERLQAEVTGRTPNFATPTNPAEREQVDIERSLYMSRQADLRSLVNASQARLVQAQRAVGEAEANLNASRTARDAARQQASMLRPLVASGVEPQLSLIQAERQANVAASQVAAAQATVARVQSGVVEARAALIQARDNWRAQAATELATAQAEAAGRRVAQPALQNRLNRTVVRAPLTGRVNRVLVNTVGGTARAAEPLVEIVPSQSGLTIEAAVRPRDIAFVRAGQRSLVKITAYDYSIYGGMEGEVVDISPDAIVDERTGETHYTVRIRTSSDTLTSPSGQRYPITSGMIADVNLIGDKRSILSYLLTPFTRLSEDAFRDR